MKKQKISLETHVDSLLPGAFSDGLFVINFFPFKIVSIKMTKVLPIFMCLPFKLYLEYMCMFSLMPIFSLIQAVRLFLPPIFLWYVHVFFTIRKIHWTFLIMCWDMLFTFLPWRIWNFNFVYQSLIFKR